jgi:aldehyde:ferredoxin oxidoreductase
VASTTAAPPGYFGSVLDIDVGGAHRAHQLAPVHLRDYLGGCGLGTRLLLDHAPAGIDALAPAAPVIFSFSPLVGTPLTTSAKFAIVAKSPLTGFVNDAMCSSHFAIAGKLSGHDAIVIRGACDTPSVVIVDHEGVRVEPAGELWGLPAAETETRLRARLGSRYRVGAIGPAGERLVRYATLSHEGRHAGRGGIGAVMGAKRVKAIAVAPSTRVESADPAGVLTLARELRERSFGPATAKYRELGTLANLLAFNALSTLPTRNFREASFEGATELSAEQLGELRERTRASCASCTIGCEHIYEARGGGGVRVEYENVFSLGPMCGVADPDAVLEASRRCDELGLDTISAGGTIAFAMECVERGLLEAPWLRFGEGHALLRAIEEIGAREGIGDLLAEGSRRVAAELGGGSGDFAPQVKGLELPGYEPRTLQTMALGLAVNPRGADHNRSGAYEADLSGELDRLHGASEHVAAAVQTEDRAAVIDSLILCKFLRGVFAEPMREWAELLAPVTGWDVSADELEQTARRIVLAKRIFNLREGWTRADDWLPERLLREPVTLASGRESTLPRERLSSMIDEYYALRGLCEDGRPARATLESHRLPAD